MYNSLHSYCSSNAVLLNYGFSIDILDYNNFQLFIPDNCNFNIIEIYLGNSILNKYTYKLIDNFFLKNYDFISNRNIDICFHLPNNLKHYNWLQSDKIELYRFCSILPVTPKRICVHPPFCTSKREFFLKFQKNAENLLDIFEQPFTQIGFELLSYVPDSVNSFCDFFSNYNYKNICCILDIEHLFYLNKFTVNSSIDRLSKYTYEVHVRDYDGRSRDSYGNRRYLNIGDGIVDFKKIYKRIIRKSKMVEKDFILEVPCKNYDYLLSQITTMKTEIGEIDI